MAAVINLCIVENDKKDTKSQVQFPINLPVGFEFFYDKTSTVTCQMIWVILKAIAWHKIARTRG